MPSSLEILFSFQVKAMKLPPPETEFRFHDKRRWRFDFAYPDKKIAIEVEGGTWTNGRHTRGSGFERDCEKYNSAAAMGWFVFRFTGKMVSSGQAITLVEKVLMQWGENK